MLCAQWGQKGLDLSVTNTQISLLCPAKVPLGIYCFSCLMALAGLLLQAADGRADGPEIVVINTSLGEIVVALDREGAPITVDNFLAYVDESAYDQSIFHRVIEGFMIQGGGFKTDLSEIPSKAPITNEAENGLRNLAGGIAMARYDVIDSATNQFFINLVDNPRLDHQEDSCTRDDERKTADLEQRGLVKPKLCTSYGYAVFGYVVAGFDVVQRIGEQQTKRQGTFFDMPAEPVIIESIRRQTSR